MKLGSLLSSAKTTVTKCAGRTCLKVRKYSPEILLGVGIAGLVGTVVLACKETLSAEEILDRHRREMKDLEDAKKVATEEPEKYQYDEGLYKKDKFVVASRTAVGFAKLYAPSIALGAFSLGCILLSRNILHRRYLSALAAYNAVSTAFYEYRERVRAEEGEIMDRHYRYGTELEKVEKTIINPETGKKEKVTEVTEKPGTAQLSDDGTARWFDSNSKQWDKDPEMNWMFLNAQQNYFTDILKTKGYLFLNEVYEDLGLPATSEGQLLGWIYGEGDNYVDLGLSNYEQSADFLAGIQDHILLTFNHDGPIWEKI